MRTHDCGADWPANRNFCPGCGKVDLDALKGVTVNGGMGRFSSNLTVKEFWETGDPSVFEKPGDRVGPLTGAPL